MGSIFNQIIEEIIGENYIAGFDFLAAFLCLGGSEMEPGCQCCCVFLVQAVEVMVGSQLVFGGHFVTGLRDYLGIVLDCTDNVG